VAAALAVRSRSDGVQVSQPVFECAASGCSALPVNLGGDSEQVVLSLFGTGMRGAVGRSAATVGGVSVGVAGPVAQGQYPGLDQVNLGPLPRSLAGRGEVEIALTTSGKVANGVTVRFQ
jgi:uncharacterized protein (TIGR03437 family)